MLNPLQRGNSGLLRDLITDAGFTDSQVVREAQRLRVNLNDSNLPIGEVYLDRPINAKILKDKLKDLSTRLMVNPSAINPEEVLDISNSESIEPRKDYEHLLISLGKELNVDVSDILRLKRNPSFTEVLETKSYSRNLRLMLHTIKVLESQIDIIEGKDVVLLLGPTRSGKSTTMLYLDGTNMVLKDPSSTPFDGVVAEQDIDIMLPQNENHPDGNIIGHATGHSCTFFPKCHSRPLLNHPDIKLVDFPGFFDTSGWQIRVAMDIVLMKLFKKAKSIRVVIILDLNSFFTTGGEIAKSTLNRLHSIYNDAERHTLVGITKHNRVENEAQKKIINSIVGRFQRIKIVQSNDSSRSSLIESILAITPLTSSKSRVTSPTEILAFRSLLEKQETIESIVYKAMILKHRFHYHENKNNDTVDINEQVTLINRVSDWLADGSIASITADTDELIKELYESNEVNLQVEVLSIDRVIADRIFKVAVYEFVHSWNTLLKAYKSGKLRIRDEDWTLLREKFSSINRKIKSFLKDKGIEFKDCAPQQNLNAFLGMFQKTKTYFSLVGFLLTTILGLISVDLDLLIYGAGSLLGLVNAYNEEIPKKNSESYIFVNSFLDSAERLISGSFKRGTMIDAEMTKLTNLI